MARPRRLPATFRSHGTSGSRPLALSRLGLLPDALDAGRRPVGLLDRGLRGVEDGRRGLGAGDDVGGVARGAEGRAAVSVAQPRAPRPRATRWGRGRSRGPRGGCRPPSARSAWAGASRLRRGHPAWAVRARREPGRRARCGTARAGARRRRASRRASSPRARARTAAAGASSVTSTRPIPPRPPVCCRFVMAAIKRSSSFAARLLRPLPGEVERR